VISSDDTRERQKTAEFLQALRSRYEAEGFIFTIEPSRASLPEFLGVYQPDAIAQKPGQNIALEVKRRTGSSQFSLAQIRQLFEGHPDWQLRITVMDNDPVSSTTIHPVGLAAIREHTNEVRLLTEQGHRTAAFILAWSLLEATLNASGLDTANRPRPARTLVQALAMNGLIDPEVERDLRGLAELRNRVAHGDLAIQPTTADIDRVLRAIEEALSADVA
jgi:uncharacterized protein YutE (UPF0331/DUF86 family)